MRCSLALAGDVMIGRGIDHVLPVSVDPRLHERYVRSACRYVELAEAESGPIPAPVDPAYPWGDALEALEGTPPALRLVNLETALTTCDDPWPDKGIHYRAHPGNVSVLEAAGIDACVLANNHVLDWGRSGLEETLETLRAADVAFAGAGRDAGAAEAPVVLEPAAGRTKGTPAEGGGPAASGDRYGRGTDRVLLFAYAFPSAGVPSDWAAAEGRPGVAFLPRPSERAADRVASAIAERRRPGDRVVVSLHWGANWGYRVPERHRSFARRLVEAGADVVHGHSSHHPEGIELHRGRPILYGCGDLVNDYEGISGHEGFRPDLVLLYLVDLPRRGSGSAEVEMLPFRIRRFRLERADPEEVRWLGGRTDRECRKRGTSVSVEAAAGGEVLRLSRDS